MFDIYDVFHYAIGIAIVVFILWVLIQVHNYFSKDNIKIDVVNGVVTNPTNNIVTSGLTKI